MGVYDWLDEDVGVAMHKRKRVGDVSPAEDDNVGDEEFLRHVLSDDGAAAAAAETVNDDDVGDHMGDVSPADDELPESSDDDDVGDVSSADDELPESSDADGLACGGREESALGNCDPFSSLRQSPASDGHPGWEAMPAGCAYKQVLIYSKVQSNETDVSCASEAAGVLTAAFPMCLEAGTDASLAKVVQRIEESSNYEVFSVSRVQNIPRAGMHGAFKSFYNIKNTRTVYHGTTLTSAASISKAGFRVACSQRSKFGKGIYTSSNVWEALAYAEPAPDTTQTFLVVDLLQGPTTLG